MKNLLTKLRTSLSNLRHLPSRGLWPFTPDPAESGLVIIGEPAEDAPLILAGNSRHALNRLDRVLAIMGGRVLAVDSEGLDLYTALAGGTLVQEDIFATVKSSAPPTPENGQTEEEDAGGALTEEIEVEAETELVSREPVLAGKESALLAYPLWKSIEEEALQETGIIPGPAVPEDLPTYFAGAGQLTEPMKITRQPLRERAQAVGSQTLLLILLLFLPLSLISIQALVTGLLLTLAAALGSIFLVPQIRRRLPWQQAWLPPTIFALTLAVVFGLLAFYLTHAVTAVAALTIAAAVVGIWLAWLCDITDSSLQHRFEQSIPEEDQPE